LHDDYTEKPAFAVYRDLVTALAARETTAAPRPKPVLRVRCVRHGWRAGLGNPPPGTRRVDFLVDGRLARHDRSAPFRATLPARLARTARMTHRLVARIPHGRRFSRRVRPCRYTATRVSDSG
jgi:hypothetical protein